MPDLRQALKDFVATSNSGKYTDEATLLSKFPELKGYDINVLKDFVATSNSGKYATEDELFAKFPEFSLGVPSKKKVDTALPSGVGSSVSQKIAKEPEEEDYFTGAFGNVLRGLDNIVPIGIGDFVDDMARSVASGYRQAKSAEEADKLLLQGTKPSMEQVQKFISANKSAGAIGPSAEMQNYQKIYENEGKGFWGVVKGLANNPSIIPEVLTSSLTAMATNTDALTAGAAAIGTGAGTGAVAGLPAGGVGAVPGAIAGATTAVPYAFGLASSVVEMGSTFGELLQEQLKGKEMTKENVKAILEDPQKLNEIRNKAIARGAIIGTVDALTGKLASGVGAKIVGKSAAKSATGAVSRRAITGATAVGAGIEALGGSAGEAAARGAIGQDMDVSEIALEGLAELPGGIRSTIQARLTKPSYKVNGEKVSAQQVDELIETMDPVDLAKTKIDIKNDYEGRQFKIQDKIVTNAIKEQVKQGNPDLNEPSLNAITDLEKQLRALEGNTTQTGKDKAAAIRSQIKNIQENQLQEEAVTETIKDEKDAIQKQATDEGLLRTEQPQVGLQQVGEGNIQPEVTTTGTEETITPEGTQKITTQIQENGQPTTTPTGGPIAGNRLFNKPLEKAKEVANGYFQRVFNTERPKFAGTRKLDEDRAKRIAAAYEAMPDNPNDPEVRAAYDAMAKETLDQYKDFVDAGFTIEIDNEEPYNNSQEMIDDLRNNNRIKIFSTEAGFGSNPITEEQRQRNPLLRDSGIKDAKGNPLLVNDVFRAIHDFYGHAELGNSFGPKGEENAWNIHARMFSPLARRAMTTETRGQNSYVNFSGVNEKIDKLREEARELREKGDEEGAKAIVDKIYQDALFAEQKIGLLPEEFSQFDEAEQGDITMRPEGLQQRDVEAQPVVEEEEKFEPLKASDVKTDTFTKDNALFYEEDERETDSGRTVTYLSSITVQATDPDGQEIGTVTKITDEDKIFYFTAEDAEGGEINLDGYETLGDAKKAIADSWNKIQKKEFDKAAKKKAKEKAKAQAKAEAKKAKAKAPVEPTVEAITEDITGTIDELLELDPNDETTLQKVSGALAQALKDIDKFERENLGVNIALPVMKTIIKAVKALVDAGVILQEAIKRVAKENNVNVRDVVNGINAISQIAPIQEAYDALMVKADQLIARQKKRGIADNKIVSNLDTFIRNSEVYQNANDAQKKIMEREARTKMGVAPKKAVSIGRVLGSLKDITNISREEKMLVIKRIRDLSRDAAKDVAKEIREMASGGKITAVQAANIIARFGKVNMLNEVSVSNFVDYMAKVFANAEYANTIDVAKSKLKAAKKNIVTKIGIADGLVGPLQRLFSMNPTLVPDAYLDRYMELVDMFSARQAVLSLEEKSVVTKDVNDILNEIDAEQSKADELADKLNYSENKVFKDDKLDYAASIKKMLDEKEIDDKEADTMRKYKDDIAPQVEETELTEAEAEQEKQELVSAVKSTQIDSSELPRKFERDKAKELEKLINTDAVNGLTNTELKNLLKVIDNINNNYFPHYAELMIEKLNAKNKGVVLENAVQKGKLAKFSKLYSNAKAVVAMQGRTGISEMIRRNPLFYIDQLFGNFKTKEIFDSIFEESAKAAAIFKTELSRVQNILENAEQKVAKSFKLDSNKTTMSKYKMMTYMIQLEFDSNKGNKEVNPAADYLKATIKHIDEGKSQFGERDAEMLQDILDNYTDADGNIDNEKLYKSFNQAEKDAIGDIRGINESLREKAEETAAIIRGDRINPLNNYVHLNVLHEHQPNDLTTGSAFVTEYNNSLRPSTKAKSLIARTGKVSPLNFNVFSSAERGAKFVLMDYNLTEPIRTARKTINEATKNLEEKGRIPKEQRQVLNAINNAFEESVENLLTNSFTQDSLLDMAFNYLNKQGYRAVLAGTSRAIAELSSNIGFAVISDPKAMNTAFKDRGIIMSADAPVIMENLKSKQTSRIFPTDALSGRLVDASILSQASGIKGGKAKNIVANKIQQIYNLSGKKFVNTVELTADTLISTPDKATMRPMWFGSFANEFKAITGKDVDFDKIAANDEAYMSDNKEALDKATKKADEKSVMIGATDNPFMGILKGTIKPEQSTALKAFNNFNNFMTKFLIFEFVTARTAVNAALGNGSLTKKQGAAVLAAVTTRMVVYGLLIQMMGNGLMGLFFDDDEPETEKSFLQKLGQAFASAFSSLLIGRDFGNAVKGVLNYGVEEANEKYLDFLREGDYDPYKDGIANTLIPRDESRATDLGKLLMNAGGAYTPSLNTAAFIYKKATEKPKKKEDAIARRERELNVRIPLEVLGNLGLVPLYKDVRKAVMKDLYKDLEKAEKTAGDKKKAKEEKLQGYENESDMKRYDPELWNRTFGPDAPDYDERQAEKELKKQKKELERAMKDEMYQYTPKPKKGKGGFGSESFGGTKKKSKGGFGSEKFGED